MSDDISLRHLKVLSLLIEVGSITQAARVLGVTQPTVSKALARLRAHFGDPLLVRSGSVMRPTPRATALAVPLRDLLSTSHSLLAASRTFDPATTHREFTCMVTEVGMLQFIPALMRRLEQAGPGLSLRALPFGSQPVEPQLEAGDADVAVGYFPEAATSLRRQGLYVDGYLSVVRNDHPRRRILSNPQQFWAERHVLMATSGAGRAANQQLEEILSARLDPALIQVRVPSFLAGAFVASGTDAIATLPARMAQFLAQKLNLFAFAPPINASLIQIDQFWHERFQQDEAHRWLRATIYQLVGTPAGRGRRLARTVHTS